MTHAMMPPIKYEQEGGLPAGDQREGRDQGQPRDSRHAHQECVPTTWVVAWWWRLLEIVGGGQSLESPLLKVLWNTWNHMMVGGRAEGL
jgi:hypothetical protein